MRWVSFFIKFTAIYFSFFSNLNGFAQLSAPDSNYYRSAVSTAINLYNRSSGDQSGLFNGMLYPGYPFLFKSGSPFFDSSRLDTGSVIYEGLLYEKLPLIYENLKDLVIINDNGFFIQLNNKKLNEFTIPGHHFIRQEENNKSNKSLTAGFYEVLYNGNIRVLKKTIKKIEDDLSSDNTVEKLITQSDYYFIKTDSTIFQVKNKKDIVDIFPDKKKEIKQFIKKNKLNFYDDKENTLIKITAYYEQIRR
jgi:hypothetical protein